MKEYLEQIKTLSTPLIEAKGLYLFRILEANEFGVNSVRIIVDSHETLDIDTELVAELTNNILDAINDLIPDDYYLEVTTRGIERELESDDEITQAIGKYIFIKLYEKHEELKEKEIYGTLNSFDGEELGLTVKIKTRKKDIKVKKGSIAKIRLAVEF